MNVPIDLTLRSGDDTSQALIDAAHQILVSDGIGALTVRRIAHEAGMSTMNVYSRFGGKDGVLRTLLISGHRALQTEFRAVALSGEIADDLMSMALAYRRFALANPSYFHLMFLDDGGGAGRPEALDGTQDTVTVVAAALEPALADDGAGTIAGRAGLEIVSAFLGACSGLLLDELHPHRDQRGQDVATAESRAARFRLGVGMMTAGLSALLERALVAP